MDFCIYARRFGECISLDTTRSPNNHNQSKTNKPIIFFSIPHTLHHHINSPPSDSLLVESFHQRPVLWNPLTNVQSFPLPRQYPRIRLPRAPRQRTTITLSKPIIPTSNPPHLTPLIDHHAVIESTRHKGDPRRGNSFQKMQFSIFT